MKRFLPLLLLLAALPVVAQNPTVQCPQAGPVLCPDNPDIRTHSMPYFTPYQQPPAPQLAGLWVMVGQGQIILANNTVTVAAARVAVQPSTTNYIYVDLATATVGTNTFGFNTITDLFFPVAIATTNQTFVTTLLDVRPDVFGGGTSGKGSCITTVANLSNACGFIAGTIASVTDGANSSDCTIGGGTSKNVCIYNGTIWTFAGSAASNPNFNQVGPGTNTNALLVAGSLAPVTLGTITATSLNNAYIDWNAVSGGAFIQNKPTLNVWSNLVSPTGNLILNEYQTPTSPFTSTLYGGDFGASPLTTSAVNTFSDNSTSSTDISPDLGCVVPTTSYHDCFLAMIDGFKQFSVFTTGTAAHVGEVAVGSAIDTHSLNSTTYNSKFWVMDTSHPVNSTFYDGHATYTGNLMKLEATAASGTGWNGLILCTGASNTDGSCPSANNVFTVRGDGQVTATNAVISSMTPGTSPVCPNGTGGALTTTGCSGGSGGFPSGVGLAGATVSGTGATSQAFIPTVDVRWFFTNPFPTYAQAQGQDFGAVLNAAFVAATSSGACVDVSGLNLLNAPNVTVLYATTNPYAGLTSNTYTPCIMGANFQVVTGATWETPAGALKVAGGVPGGIGDTGFVVQPCNTTGGCSNGSGGISVTQFPTSAGCSSSGGLNCYATGLPSSSALTTYTTGTLTCTNGSRTCTGSGTTWTSAMIGGTLLSSCLSNTCTIGSTSSYVTGRIVAVGSTTSLTLEANWAGVSTAAEKYIIFNPNTSVAWCDGCLAGSLQKSFTGHEIDDLTIDLNGISGAGFYTKSSQEGSILNNYTCFMQFSTPTGATPGGTCLAWDQSVREASGSGQTFLGHWSVYGGRIGMGNNAGGSSAFGAVVEGYSIMDGSVANSQVNGASILELQAIIGGSGSARFQDDAYIDGVNGMFIAGTHTESSLNDHWNIGPVNPVYNVNLNAVTSSGTLGGCVIELHTNTSGNQIHGVSRASGGCLAKDDNLTTPTIGTSVSGTPASWTIPEYIQQGNAGDSIVASGSAVITGTMTANNFQWVGPLYISGPIPASPMSATTSGNSAIGISNDGNLYLSNNGGTINEFANLATANTWTANQTLTGEITINGHDIAKPLDCDDTSGSGTAQVCNTSPTFTPVAGDCMLYETTTSNTGTGLTINWNSLGAKSVAKWQTTTTLAANDIRANTEVLACYDGTNIEIATIGNVPAGGGGGDTITSPNSTLVVGGTSSATTLDLAGAAGEIMAGATPALTFTPTFGKSGTAGTLSLFPSSGNFTTTLGSAATASNTVNFFASVPTNLHMMYCATSSTTCTLTDTGYAYNAIPVGNIGSAGLSGTSPISIVSTGAISCASCVTSNASLTSNQAVNGSGSQGSATGFTDSTGTVTSGHLACYTASNTIGNCTGTPSNNILGVFTSSSTWIASGEQSVVLDATVNVTVGDILCVSATSAGTAHDNGSGACTTGEWVGIVKTTASSVSSATAFVALR